MCDDPKIAPVNGLHVQTMAASVPIQVSIFGQTAATNHQHTYIHIDIEKREYV